MRFSLAALALANAVTVLAAPQVDPGRFSCGAPEPSAEHVAISQAFAKDEAMAIANGTVTKRAVTTIDVYFHVVASSTAASGGYLSVSF